MRGLERYLFVPVLAARPYLLAKGTLVLLAFDLWLTRIEHGGRYGAGGFNVTHFAWLDAFSSSVSPALYVGLTIATGALALGLAVAPSPPRWALALLALLHTAGWAMSMLDSYQHHYLLSLVLVALACFPQLSAEQALVPPGSIEEPKAKAKRTKPKKAARASLPPSVELPRTVAWGYVALSLSIAIVYAYTAYSKTADEWLAGAALQRVTNGGAVLAPMRELFARFGLDARGFWSMMGHATVVVQIVCSAGYVLAPLHDVARSRWTRIFASVALVTALSFHAGAEYMDLRIGWFSWYMMFYACVMMLPERIVHAAAWLWSGLGASPWRWRAPSAGFFAAALAPGVLLFLLSLISWRAALPFALLAIFAGVGGWAVLGLRWDPSVSARSDSIGAAVRTLTALVLIPIGFLDWRACFWLGGLLLLVGPLRFLLTRARASSLAVQGASLALAALGLAAIGFVLDLPGAGAGTALAAVGLALAGGLALWRKEGALVYALGAALAAPALWLCVVLSTVRYDYYRNVGGDHRRRQEYREAYEAYRQANRYAPEGDNRQREEAQMRQMLEQRGERP